MAISMLGTPVETLLNGGVSVVSAKNAVAMNIFYPMRGVMLCPAYEWRTPFPQE
jgi:hypothetical protein